MIEILVSWNPLRHPDAPLEKKCTCGYPKEKLKIVEFQRDPL